jgi:hypothetical protein
LVGLVVGRKRDGRCRYDPEVKQELVRRCMAPGVSVARMAMQHGINANLLWVVSVTSSRHYCLYGRILISVIPPVSTALARRNVLRQVNSSMNAKY